MHKRQSPGPTFFAGSAAASIALAFAVAASRAIAAVGPAGTAEEKLGRLAFAEEFAVFAQAAITQPTTNDKAATTAKVRRTAALLKAASLECEFEPRFPRLLGEACIELGDREGAIDALTRYRLIQLPDVQNDQFAQVKLIDLYTASQQTEDDRIKYLRIVLQTKAVPEPVRSHVAFSLSKLLADKFDLQGQKDMVAESLRLNSLNPEALRARYSLVQADGTAAERVTALVGLLRSDPSQPQIMNLIADTLASAGQSDAAVDWYRRSFDLSKQLGMGLDGSKYLDYAAALQIMGQPRKADEAAQQVLSANSANARAATLRLLIARQLVNFPISGSAAAEPQTVDRAKQAARAAIAAQIGTMHAQLRGTVGAATTQASATQPADLLGIIDADSDKLRQFKNDPKASAAQASFLDTYTAALENLIWYYVYFDPQPAQADRLLAVLKPLVPADDPETVRLQGYSYLAAGKKDEAKVKFSAVATQDPLAQMGLILIDPAAPGAAATAQDLVTRNASGILGTTLLDGLHDKGGKFVASADSTAAADASRSFPIPLLEMLTPGGGQKFYSILARPVRTANHFDEPILARVTIQNTGDYDLAVGEGGAIHSDLWFDAFVQGAPDPNFSGVAYDRISGPLVLKAHRLELPGTAQTVRVDQGDLADYMFKHPTVAVSLLFSVFPNPVSQQSGVAPGPGGYRQQFASPMERIASPVNTPQQVQDVTSPAISGTIPDRIHGLQLLASYILVLRDQLHANPAGNPAPAAAGAPGAVGQLPAPAGANPAIPPNPGANKNTQNVIDSFTAALQGDLRDSSKLVRFWAQYQAGMVSSPADREATATVMLAGEDWEQRALGLILANTLSADKTRLLCEKLTGDSNDAVKSLAEATSALTAYTTIKK